jgi:hypothetical protein
MEAERVPELKELLDPKYHSGFARLEIGRHTVEAHTLSHDTRCGL